MYFEQFYLACLSHASYMIGSDGIAAVVDPQRDVEVYIDTAREHGLNIRYIIETHLHADFVSGHRELAEMSSAEIYISSHAEATFPHVDVKDGDAIKFGKCKLQFLETPGHSLDSISIVVTDAEKSSQPVAVLTGDSLFIGDVGRPDLAKDKTPQQMAGMLYDSLHGKILRLGDDVHVYPAHGAGSLCGRQMSNARSSTIGREKATNAALRARTREEFVRMITSELPDLPEYFAIDREINRAGAGSLEELPPLRALTPQHVVGFQKAEALVLDTRPAEKFAATHVPGAIHVGLSGQFATWAGIVVGLGRDVVIISENQDKIEETRTRLARVGIERVVGYLDGGIDSWTAASMPTQTIRQITTEQLRREMREQPQLQVIDVRRQMEWDDGHISGAKLMPLQKLASSIDALDNTRPVAVHCKSGYRSLIAASLLQSAGFERVMNVVGGFDAWRASDLPVARGTAAA